MPNHGTVDLNADLGESTDPAHLAIDIELLKIVTSANIACGEKGHAGDERTMSKIVRAAIANNVAIGAHPSYPDRANFGRTAMNLTCEQIEQTVREQLGALEAIAGRHKRQIQHIKPHGALYHAANTNPGIASAIARAAVSFGDTIILVGQARSLALEVWNALGCATTAEAFADRRYEPDGTLRSRMLPDSLIADPVEAAAQAVEIAMHRRVSASDGSRIQLHADTICIHSDTPNALEVARAVRSALEASGMAIAHP